jgi:hypothetical protein
MSGEAAAVARETKKPAGTRRRSRLVQALVGAVVGGAGAVLALSLAPQLAPELDPADKAALRHLGAALPLAAGLAALVCGWTVIAFHELGHVAAGLAVGFRFQLFVAGPLRVEREGAEERVKAGLNREFSLYGGVAACLPVDTRDLPRRFVWVFAGGPLASVALALAGWAAVAWLPGAPAGLRMLGMVVAMMSAAIGLGTLIPMRGGGFASDGARLLRMFRGGPEARREAATLSLVALAFRRARLEEIIRAADAIDRAAAV